MRSILAKIAAVMRSLPRFVYERACIAGEWISRLVAVPAEPGVLEPAGDVPAIPEDEDSVSTRAIAGLLLAGKIPAPELSGKVSEDRFHWLLSLSPAMLKALTEADAKALRDHLRQVKNLKGVLAADAETVRAYNHRRDAEESPDQAWKPALSM